MRPTTHILSLRRSGPDFKLLIFNFPGSWKLVAALDEAPFGALYLSLWF